MEIRGLRVTDTVDILPLLRCLQRSRNNRLLAKAGRQQAGIRRCNRVQEAARPVATSTAAGDTTQAGLFVSDELAKQEDVVSNAKMYR